MAVPETRFLLLSAEDWQLAREARLAALRDSPGSFLPTVPHEVCWNDEQWQASCETGLWAVARSGASVVGLARLTRDRDGPHVGSVWTHPRRRRERIASRLVRMLVSEVGEGDIFVWIIQPNPEAIKLYESLGFERTGEVQRLHRVGRNEERLRFNAAFQRD